jgi:2-keto-4-pentenoate hydratase
MAVDPRLVSALTAQLEQRDAALARGARRVGWKLGMGDAERIGDGPVVGHLTSATLLDPGAAFGPDANAALHADTELAVRIGTATPGAGEVVIDGYAVGLELVDLAGADDGPEQIVAANIFHRAFTLGPPIPSLPADAIAGRLLVDGELRDSAPAEDVTARVQAAARILAAIGEPLRAGDWIITGSIVQVPVDPGVTVTADLGRVGSVSLTIERG